MTILIKVTNDKNGATDHIAKVTVLDKNPAESDDPHTIADEIVLKPGESTEQYIHDSRYVVVTEKPDE